MLNLRKPKWLLLINTLPLAMLAWLLMGQYSIINSLLSDKSQHLWKLYGYLLFGLGSSNLLYTLFLILKKKPVSGWYGLIALLAYIPVLYLYFNDINLILPFSVPGWMLPDNAALYAGTFIMPTLVYALLLLVGHFTSEEKNHKAWKSFLASIAVPITWYLFTQLILPFWQNVDNDFSIHAVIVFFILGTILFLFFLIRGIYIVSINGSGKWQKYQLAWKIPITIVFPLIGLAINNGDLLDWFSRGNNNLFGIFNNPWFYRIALINGLVLCLPNWENKTYRLVLFALRSFSFSFTLYFFLVFLPYLPISVLAIIVFGAGFLMLTPLVMGVIHVYELNKDFKFVSAFKSKPILRLLSFLSFLTIPFCLTLNNLNDKKTMNLALEYLYSPDYSRSYAIDKKALSEVLNTVERHKKGNNRDVLFAGNTPYLSTYYNWLVLDNLTLSDSKIQALQNVFFGTSSIELNEENIENSGVKISKISSASRYDNKQQAWISQLDLEITNTNDNAWRAEYATTFNLPPGCFISDYYLVVNGKKEAGMLAEKKTAMWVFSEIRNTNRDPGLLYYLTGNKVAFRIFPFGEKETRKTGIEFIHKDPVTLTLDSNQVQLGDSSIHSPAGNITTITNNDAAKRGVVYISPEQKKELPRIQRKPYFHFIIDASLNGCEHKPQFIRQVQNLLNSGLISKENAQVSFVNSYVNTVPLSGNWQKTYNELECQGGFYLERAIKTGLYHADTLRGLSYPVFLVLSDYMPGAILDKDFSDFKSAYPESDLFFVADTLGKLHAHSLSEKPMEQLPDSVKPELNNYVRAYPNPVYPLTFLPDDDKGAIVITNSNIDLNSLPAGKNWNSALAMQGYWMWQTFNPQGNNDAWLSMIKSSFKTGIMNPTTAYLVVENEAQKAALKKKQEEVMSGNKSLDPGEDLQRMSEPGLLLTCILFALFIWFTKKRKRDGLLN